LSEIVNPLAVGLGGRDRSPNWKETMPTIPESHRDLLDASLSTVGDDGAPQVTAIWFVFEGDTS
jgi:hypothetical protein